MSMFWYIDVANNYLLLSAPALAAVQRQVATLSTPGAEKTLILPAAAGRLPVISFDKGETKKETLEAGDIAGVKALY